MKIRTLFTAVSASLLLSLTATSCADWLRVDMEDGIMEDKLYESNEGYMASLNGVYSKMNELYSSTLGMTTLDVMAQYYNVDQNSNHSFYVYANYQFDQDRFDSMSGNVWTGLYFLIANLNTLIEHCDEPHSALKPHYYPYVKGEALALRALMHFDLLRLYGPIYSDATADTPCITYQETTSKEIQPLLPAREVLAKVIRDLTDAAAILKDDKIRTDGVMNSDSDDPNESTDFRYRQFRLNYYAVQALLARAYLWMGDKAKAYETAHALIAENEEKKVFNWTPKANVQASNNPDRLFSTEVMFALYNLQRTNLYDTYFNNTASINNSLTFVGESVDAGQTESKINHFYTDIDDLRRGMWTVETLEQSNESGTTTSKKAVCFHKYEDVSTTNTLRYMVPLVRMSEIYLIAAECAPTQEEAIGYVNDVRRNRNCVDIALTEKDTPETIQAYITSEFAREVIGEGQLYFYYKRHAMAEVMSGSDFGTWSGPFKMKPENYVWPLPKAEADKRVSTH